MEDKSYRRTLHSIIENHIPKDILDERNKSKSWDYGYNKEFDMVVISKNGTIGNVIDINDLAIALPKQPEKIRNEIIELTEKMFELAESLRFEDAARVRDRIRELERKI